MKKLLGLLGTVQMITIPALSVVACESNANYKEFKSWVDAKESFVLYIGADDCEHCKDFDKFLGMKNATQTGEEVLKDGLEKMRTDYNDHLKSGGWNSGEESVNNLLGYTSVNQISFHKFKYDNFDDIWNDTKSMKNIRDWEVDQYESILKQQGNNNYIDNDNMDDALKQLVSTTGTPIFMIIRNGKFIGQVSGFEGSSSDIEAQGNALIESISKVWTTNADEVITNLFTAAQDAVNNYKKTSESLGFNYDDVDLNNYL
jgi:hypothetical protein